MPRFVSIVLLGVLMAVAACGGATSASSTDTTPATGPGPGVQMVHSAAAYCRKIKTAGEAWALLRGDISDRTGAATARNPG